MGSIGTGYGTMTVRKSKSAKCMIAQCDICFDVVEFEDLDGSERDHWSEAKNAIDADGWKTKRSGAGWINISPDCQD